MFAVFVTLTCGTGGTVTVLVHGGGVLFGASREGHLRITPGVIGAYVLVSLLHGL